MLSPYRLLATSNTPTRRQKTLKHTEHHLKMTSNDLKNDLKGNDKAIYFLKKIKTKNNLKAGNPNHDKSTQ